MATVGRQSWVRDLMRDVGCTVERIEGLKHSYLVTAEGQSPHLMVADWARGEAVQEAIAALAIAELYRELVGEDALRAALGRLVSGDCEAIRADLFGHPRVAA